MPRSFDLGIVPFSKLGTLALRPLAHGTAAPTPHYHMPVRPVVWIAPRTVLGSTTGSRPLAHGTAATRAALPHGRAARGTRGVPRVSRPARPPPPPLAPRQPPGLCAACAPWAVATPVRHAARPHNRTATANALPATPHGRACMPKARVCRGGAGLIVRPAHGAALFRRVQTASAAGARAATDAILEMRHNHLHHRSQRRRNHLIAPGPPPPPPPPQHTCADLAHCVNSAAATDGEAPCLSRGCGCTGDASANPSVVYGCFPLGGTACGWCLPSGRSLNHGEATATCAKQCPHLKYVWPHAGRGRQLGVWTGRHCSGRARPATGSTPHPPQLNAVAGRGCSPGATKTRPRPAPRALRRSSGTPTAPPPPPATTTATAAMPATTKSTPHGPTASPCANPCASASPTLAVQAETPATCRCTRTFP